MDIASLSPPRAGQLGARLCARRIQLLFLVSLGLLWNTAVHAVDVRDSVRAWRDHEAVIVEAQAELDAPLQTAWQVLTGYEHYAEFIPDLHSSRVLARSGNTAIVEQKGEAGFFLFHFPLEITLSVTEVPGSAVNSRAISGTFKEMTGSYVLTESNSGVRLTYNGRLVPAFYLPPLIGVPAVRAAVERQFTALVREIRRIAKAGSGSSDVH